MKLVSYIMGEEERIGAIDTADRIVDLHRAYGNYLQRFGSDPDLHKRAAATLGHDMVEFLQRGTASLSAARQALAHIAAQPLRDSSFV